MSERVKELLFEATITSGGMLPIRGVPNKVTESTTIVAAAPCRATHATERSVNGRADFFLAGARPHALGGPIDPQQGPSSQRAKSMGQRDRLRHHEARTQDED